MHRGMSVGAFRKIGRVAALGALLVILLLAGAASARAVTPKVLPPPQNSCSVGQMSVQGINYANGIPTRIQVIMVLSCLTGTKITGMGGIQEWIPLNQGWANVYITTSYGTSVDVMSFSVPCFPPSPSGSTREYRGEIAWSVVFPDGQSSSLPTLFTASHDIGCEARLG